MKNILLAILFMAGTASAADEYFTLHNATDVTAQASITWTDSGGSHAADYLVVPGADLYLPKNASGTIGAVSQGRYRSFNLTGNAPTPLCMLNIYMQPQWLGAWANLYGNTGDIAAGFSLGLAVWAVCGGSAWLVGIGKQFVNAAS